MLRRSFTTQLVRDGCFVRIFRDTHRRNSTQSQPNTRFIQFLTTVPISIRRVIFEISSLLYPLPHTFYTPDFFSFFFTAKIRRVNRLECGSFGTSLNRGYTSCVPVDEHVFLTEISRSFWPNANRFYNKFKFKLFTRVFRFVFLGGSYVYIYIYEYMRVDACVYTQYLYSLARTSAKIDLHVTTRPILFTPLSFSQNFLRDIVQEL